MLQRERTPHTPHTPHTPGVYIHVCVCKGLGGWRSGVGRAAKVADTKIVPSEEVVDGNITQVGVSKLLLNLLLNVVLALCGCVCVCVCGNVHV